MALSASLDLNYIGRGSGREQRRIPWTRNDATIRVEPRSDGGKKVPAIVGTEPLANSITITFTRARFNYPEDAPMM